MNVYHSLWRFFVITNLLIPDVVKKVHHVFLQVKRINVVVLMVVYWEKHMYILKLKREVKLINFAHVQLFCSFCTYAKISMYAI